MILDPILVAPEPVARVQHWTHPVCSACKLVQPTARQHAKAGKIGLKPHAQRRRQVERQELLEPSVDGVKILPRTIRCNG